MTPLAVLLKRQIKAHGPMPLSDYMAACLLHPDHGYYTGRDPFGAKGDFTTAPEISQMFGEMIGLWLAQCWMMQGRPDPFILAEAGPGRGTLMADALRATHAVSGFHDAMQVVLIEASPKLQAQQQATLAAYGPNWLPSLSDLPDGPLFFVANEFFDALPVRQFVRDPGGWRECQVGLVKDALTLGLSEPAPVAHLDHRLQDTSNGDVVELCQPAQIVMADLAQRLAQNGGVGLILDYGGWHSRGDTVQAVRNHESEDILANPGQADLTAHVDFEALANAAKHVAVTEMVPQGVFLERLGITARAQALARNLTGAELDSHVAAHRRLTHPDEMGNLFKAMALFPDHTETPPGFAQ